MGAATFTATEACYRILATVSSAVSCANTGREQPF